MKLTLHKILAFLKRDFRIETSYKLNFVMVALSSLVPLFSFYFISKMVDADATAGVQKYGSSYFTFVVIGLAFTRYFELAVSTFAGSMQRAQMTGCLEAMLSSQTRPEGVVILSSLYSLLSSALQLILIFAAGSLFLGFDLGSINWLSTLLIFFISLLTFISFGIISSAVIILFKKGDPISWALTTASSLLGGALFPIEILPDWLYTLAKANPVTYALDALRRTMLQGYGLADITEQLLILGGINLLLFPTSILIFIAAIRKARRDGTLMHY